MRTWVVSNRQNDGSLSIRSSVGGGWGLLVGDASSRNSVDDPVDDSVNGSLESDSRLSSFA